MPTTSSRTGDERPVCLDELIRIQPRFLRSVNLERDFYSDEALHGYIVTPCAATTFQRIAAGVKQPSARAFTITGPYGTGKSAFALCLSRVLAATERGDNPSRRRICDAVPNLAEQLFEEHGAGYWPILVTGARASAGRTLVEGLIAGLERSPFPAAREVQQALEQSHGTILSAEHPSAREVTSLFAEASRVACRLSDDCRGLLLIVDELGKLLEYAATNPAHGDMQVLQELAEYASRSSEAPLLVVTILHQAFEDYSHRLSALQRTEWRKVQGRFIDIPYGDGPDVALDLISKAIKPIDDPLLDEAVRNRLDQDLASCEKLQLFPDRLSATEFQRILQRTYPLHPLALLIMPHLFRRFGQNERSLFTFLAGDEPLGFKEFLRTHSVGEDSTPVLGVEHLYDYVIAAMGTALYSQTTAKLWSETEEALFRVRDRDALQAKLVKVIGLLSILGEQTGILPSRDVLIFALPQEDVAPAIEALETATLITYRQFKRAYRLYEGSDIDIDARLKEARVQFSHGADPIKTAGAVGATSPLVARRHSFETGALRYFDVRYCRPHDIEQEISRGPEQGHGLLLLCLADDAVELTAARATIGAVLPQHPHVIVGLNEESEALHEAAVAVETLLWVRENTHELRNDRVAAREVRERLLDAKLAFETEWERLLRPQSGMEGGAWFYAHEEKKLDSYRELQRLVSAACDAAYPKTPRLLNELINRRQLSSSAAAARRNLIQAMIENRGVPRLGLEGYPPEVSMYVSVLENTGIHRRENDRWGLYPPPPDGDQGLIAVWNAIEEFLFSEDQPDRSVARLNEVLRDRPYGLTDGVIPVLLCAVLLSNEAEVAVYA